MAYHPSYIVLLDMRLVHQWIFLESGMRLVQEWIFLQVVVIASFATIYAYENSLASVKTLSLFAGVKTRFSP
jgi:hypothetical protein